MSNDPSKRPHSRSIFRHVLEYDEENRRIVVYRVSATIPMHLYTHFDLDMLERKTLTEALEHLGLILIADSPFGNILGRSEDTK